MAFKTLPIELSNGGIKRWLCLHVKIQRRPAMPEIGAARAPLEYANPWEKACTSPGAGPPFFHDALDRLPPRAVFPPSPGRRGAGPSWLFAEKPKRPPT